MFLGYKRNYEEFQEIHLKTRNEIIYELTNLDEFYNNAINKIKNEMETFQIRVSQWVLHSILRMELRINKYIPLRGSSYIPLPEVLANKKAMINVQNNENKCFLWAIFFCSAPCK